VAGTTVPGAIAAITEASTRNVTVGVGTQSDVTVKDDLS
jgi:hypothetical protein